MSSRREERNEKIIRGLMKLPPNRRCINCNSMGPQYVCTNFWTFVCITCSGVHREFTHRVKSVSMSKFTSQEVDSLQKCGNQRARELFLKAWDQRNKLPDNSNVENIREFIKNVYVNKMYSTEISSNKPPRDQQSLRIQEDETRRASSYHSYSQSPPYDFQYEERQYGKQAAVLARKPGSDLGLFEGKLASFLSPTHLSDDGFANEGSNPRVSDYSVSGGGDSQRNFGSPSRETSGDISREVPQSGGNIKRSSGKSSHLQRPMSTGSFGSIDSNFGSFKSINSLPEAGTGPGHTAEISIKKSSSLPSLPFSMAPKTFNDFDLFSAPFAPNTTHIAMQSTQELSQIPQTKPLNLFDTLSQQHPSSSFNKNASDVVTPDNVGWATFDVPQNTVSVGSENSAFSDGIVFGNFNPFTIDPSLDQNLTNYNPFVSANSFVHGNQQSFPAAVNHTDPWNVFGDSTGEELNTVFSESNEQHAEYSTLNTDKFFDFGAPEVDSSIVNQPQTYSFAADLRPTNPFDMPFDKDVESSNVSQVWDVSSLQGALLTTTQMPSVSNVEVTELWFTENPIPSYAPVTGSIAGQAPDEQKSKPHGQGPATSAGGNPFA